MNTFCWASKKGRKEVSQLIKSVTLCGLPSSTLVCNAHAVRMNNKVSIRKHDRGVPVPCSQLPFCGVHRLRMSVPQNVEYLVDIAVLKNSCVEY